LPGSHDTRPDSKAEVGEIRKNTEPISGYFNFLAQVNYSGSNCFVLFVSPFSIALLDFTTTAKKRKSTFNGSIFQDPLSSPPTYNFERHLAQTDGHMWLISPTSVFSEPLEERQKNARVMYSTFVFVALRLRSYIFAERLFIIEYPYG
jgi:hypothetical protein